MKKVMRFFLPKERKFFDMLSEQSKTAVEASKELAGFLDEYEKIERGIRKEKVKSLKILKDKSGDEAKRIMLELGKGHKASIDKRDILIISTVIYEITCIIHSISSRLVTMGIERIDDYSPKLLSAVNKCIDEADKLIKNLDNPKGAEEHHSGMTNLKSDAEEMYDEALSELFHFYKNSMDIIKYREIYGLMERIIEKSFEISCAARVLAKHK